ncbi:PD-(D/E)XK nuclease family transposase [Candidatus Poribacteria bacterium]|nr:PD-(D/E)XK nuclease family transposase [Candidatus Poribacteria bacterium]
MPIFIDPTTDFGFKKLFGEERSEGVLKHFLYDILGLPSRIQKIIHFPQERLPQSEDERRGVLDLYCMDENGERFIVEMQNAQQRYFKDRAVYYSMFPIADQAKKGKEWEYQLQPVYCLGVLGFSLSEDGSYFSTIKLTKEETNQVFYEKLTFVFVELPNFDLSLSQVSTPREKWIYFLNHLPELDEIPPELSDDSFREAFEIAHYAALSRQERYLYEHSLKVARDNYAIQMTLEEDAMARGLEQGLEQGLQQGLQQGLEQGVQQGLEQGVQQGLQQGLEQGLQQGIEQGLQQGVGQGIAKVAIAMLKDNTPLDAIAKYTGLSEDEIKQLTQVNGR